MQDPRAPSVTAIPTMQWLPSSRAASSAVYSAFPASSAASFLHAPQMSGYDIRREGEMERGGREGGGGGGWVWRGTEVLTVFQQAADKSIPDDGRMDVHAAGGTSDDGRLR